MERFQHDNKKTGISAGEHGEPQGRRTHNLYCGIYCDVDGCQCTGLGCKLWDTEYGLKELCRWGAFCPGCYRKWGVPQMLTTKLVEGTRSLRTVILCRLSLQTTPGQSAGFLTRGFVPHLPADGRATIPRPSMGLLSDGKPLVKGGFMTLTFKCFLTEFYFTLFDLFC